MYALACVKIYSCVPAIYLIYFSDYITVASCWLNYLKWQRTIWLRKVSQCVPAFSTRHLMTLSSILCTTIQMTSFFHSGRSDSNRKHVQVMLLLREAGFNLSSTENTPSGWNLVSLAEVQIHPASAKAFNAFSKPTFPL
jgi:hypothetical protein